MYLAMAMLEEFIAARMDEIYAMSVSGRGRRQEAWARRV